MLGHNQLLLPPADVYDVQDNQSELLYGALKKAGVDVTFVPVKGAGHGFGGPEVIAPVRDFLTRCFKE